MDSRRYLIVFLAVVALGLSLLLVSLAFLWRAGELEDADAIALLQGSSAPTMIYGSALNQNTFPYKRALVALQRPDVLIAGSSRVMQFRQGNFPGRQVTAGGAGSSIDEVSEFLAGTLREYRPRVLVLGVDFWWFHPDYRGSLRTDLSGHEVTRDKLLWVFEELRRGKVTLPEVTRILLEADPQRRGLNAKLRGEGFRRDGSWRYAIDVPAFWRRETGFANTLGRIRAGKEQFLYGDRPDPQRLLAFDRLVDEARRQGIQVYLFMPPLAPTTYRQLQRQADDYRYLGALRSRSWPAPMLDLTDPATLGASDCEFIDGFHGGDVVYARIASLIAAQGGMGVPVDNQRRASLRDRPTYDEPPADHLHLRCPVGG